MSTMTTVFLRIYWHVQLLWVSSIVDVRVFWQPDLY